MDFIKENATASDDSVFSTSAPTRYVTEDLGAVYYIASSLRV